MNVKYCGGTSIRMAFKYAICFAALSSCSVSFALCGPPEQLLGTFESPLEAVFASKHTQLKTYTNMGLLTFELKLHSRSFKNHERGPVVFECVGTPMIRMSSLLVPTVQMVEDDSTGESKSMPVLSIDEYRPYSEGDEVLLAAPKTIVRISENKPVRPSDVLIRTSRMPKTGVDPMGKVLGEIPSIQKFKSIRWAYHAERGGPVPSEDKR